MAKLISRARTSPAVKKNQTPTEKSPQSVVRQHLLTMTEDEGLQVQEARCMLQLLEDMTLHGGREITISSGPLAVMMAVIQKKLAFQARLMPVDAAGFLQER